ncbi:hypothetical protein M378DRAFT_165722 [Amanita muscaria Koide BX008]|uniref:Uncharacterized protein n=1 Tax=Amanita muscaria (strain Koide BX008) TaxID=946122 RepID=A0A0C2SGX8_AMAMK|nr:hypothetical protein M378DRAFT_165722 [Amanita muscaria Koide BX008]
MISRDHDNPRWFATDRDCRRCVGPVALLTTAGTEGKVDNQIFMDPPLGDPTSGKAATGSKTEVMSERYDSSGVLVE